MKVLIACEFSGRVRDAFIVEGHDAMSCDILETEQPGPHYTGDIRDILDDGWDLMIAHPPCTYLAASGLHWNKRKPEREQQTIDALAFIETLWTSNIPKIALENPVGCINTRLKFMPKPQYVQPYEFGDDVSKKTGLWLKGLPRLEPTQFIEPRIIEDASGRKFKRWGNQSDCGRDNTPNNADRGKNRSRTHWGLAIAMAEQWG